MPAVGFVFEVARETVARIIDHDMAFDLKCVLKAMLFASNGPLSVKDIQMAVSRFHEQEINLPFEGEGEIPAVPEEQVSPEVAVENSSGKTAWNEAAVSVPTVESEAAQAPTLTPGEDDEMYRGVPALVTIAQIQEAMDTISAELRAAESQVLVIEGVAGWRLVTHPRFARWVRLLRNEPPPVRLSASALETLAVISYRQPVTRGEIEQIRGVSADAGITKLLERNLVYAIGRADLPGRPIQYGTTDAFLEFVGIKSLDELPASDLLSPRQVDAWLKSMQLQKIGDSEMGLDETKESQHSLESVADKASAEKPAPVSETSF